MNISGIMQARQMDLKDLLQELLTNISQGSRIRDALNERLAAHRIATLYDLVLHDAKYAGKNDPPNHQFPSQAGKLGFSIHELAKQMLKDDFVGQGMRETEKAEDYIYLAADNPDVEEELPEAGFAFWKAADFQYRIWKARRNRGASEEK